MWYRSVTKVMKHKFQTAQNKILHMLDFLNIQSRVGYLSLIKMVSLISNEMVSNYGITYLTVLNAVETSELSNLFVSVTSTTEVSNR